MTVITDNRWDRALHERSLVGQPITDDFNYLGNISVDWPTIYSDLNPLDNWVEQDWSTWNWRVTEYAVEPPFPLTDATKNIDLKQSQFYSTIGTDLDNYAPIKSILDILGIYMPNEFRDKSNKFQSCRIHRQMPGQILWMHYDFSADENWEQYFVYLNDWTPGQVSLIGTKAITNWRSGDVYQVNGLISPHGATNCGYGERWLAVIKGARRAPVDFGRFVDRP